MNANLMIHDSANVTSKNIGNGTTIWQYVIVLPGAQIGANVNICAHCLVENDVVIGDRVTVKSGVYLWNGTRLEDDVFIGPNVTFTNDKYPRSKIYPHKFLSTLVEKGATVGGGAVLLPGITIGRGAMVGAGAVVTKSVPPYAVVAGSPARITGYVDSAISSSYGKSSTVQAPAYSCDKIVKLGVGDVALHHMKLVQDMRGNLSVGEFQKDIPFDPKRYFLVFDVPSEKTRGEHAHHKCHQFLICVKGSCAVVVDDAKSRCEVFLNSPDMGIHLPPLTWGIQYKYSRDAVLLVFTSEYYDANDYIRNYTEFIDLTEQSAKRKNNDD
jgi:acetyltransferase-like isoleucine patch superfamily enzyme/dTDP-4-dehydrorhamnose 3,5-epimerase-like enzyme